MTTDPKILEEAKGHINFLLRQISSSTSIFPIKVPATERLRSLVDEQTAQRLYEELILELEKTSGVKIERKDY